MSGVLVVTCNHLQWKLSCCSKFGMQVWDIESGRQLRVQQQHTNWVMDLLYIAAPIKMLFSCSLDGNIIVWNERGRLLQVRHRVLKPTPHPKLTISTSCRISARSRLHNITLVATKVHLILKSFVVVMWMHDKRELL